MRHLALGGILAAALVFADGAAAQDAQPAGDPEIVVTGTRDIDAEIRATSSAR